MLIIGRTGLGWQINFQEIMGRESFYVVRFDLGSLLQGQTRIPKLKSACVTCHFKTFGRFETATAVLIPLQGLEMAWPFRNGQLFLLAVLIPHQFDIGGQVCSVAFKYNSITIKNSIFN